MSLKEFMAGSHSKPLGTLAERDKHAEQLLATRYDALNQLLNEAELHLRGLKPIHPVWHEYNHSQVPGNLCHWEVLGMTKHQGKWRICHGTDHDENVFGIDNLKPIVECPVDIRVRAASEVRLLHEKMVKSKEEYIPQVEAAIKELTELCVNVL